MKAWEKRALNPNTPTIKIKGKDGRVQDATIQSGSSPHPETGKEILYPFIRLIDGKLVKLDPKEAKEHALKKGDYYEFDTPDEADAYSRNLSDRINEARKENMPGYKKQPYTKKKRKRLTKKMLQSTKVPDEPSDYKKGYGDWLKED